MDGYSLRAVLLYRDINDAFTHHYLLGRILLVTKYILSYYSKESRIYGVQILNTVWRNVLTRIKSFADLIVMWSTNLMGWILGFAMHDLIEIATLIKEISATAAFIATIIYTIHRIRKNKREKDNKK